MDTQRTFTVAPPAASDDILVNDRTTVRAFREARFFLRLTRLVSSGFAPEQLLLELFPLLEDIFPLSRIALVQLAPDETPIVVEYPVSPSDNLAAQEFLLEIARALIETQKIQESAPLLELFDRPTLGLTNTPAHSQSILAAPLSRQSNIKSVFVVESHIPEANITEQDRDIIRAVAQQLALLFEREHAIREARRRSDQMAAFSTVASTVNEWVDLEQLSRRFLAVFLNTTNTNHGLFYLLERDEVLVLVGHFGIPPEYVDAFRVGHLSMNAEFRRVVELGRLAILDDLMSLDVSYRARQLTRLVPVESLLLLPLRVKGRVIGMVSLGKTEGRIELPDREFIQGLGDQAAQAIENTRLFAEAERRFKEQSALRELAQRFLAEVSPDQVLEQTLDTLTQLIPGDLYEILLPDTQGAFVLVNGRGWRRGVVGRVRTGSDPHLYAGYVLRAQSPVVVENFATEIRFQPSDYLVRHQVVAGLCAPMLAEARVLGLLGVYSRTFRQFTEEQAHFLYLVATQTAIALEKARHLLTARRSLDELALLNDVIVAANSEVSLERVLESVTAEIGELLSSVDVHVTFSPENSDDDRLVTLTSASADPARWGDSLAAYVMASHKPLLVHDLQADTRFAGAAWSVRACLAAPMAIGDRVIGVIAVAHPSANRYDTNDLRLLATLAGHIAAAIARVRLLDETGRRLAEISAMFEYSNALRAAATEESLFDLVVRDATTILGATGSSLQLLAGDKESLEVVAVCNMDHRGLVLRRYVGGLSWEVFAAGEALAVDDVLNDRRVSLPEVFVNMHGAIVAPLRTHSHVMGSLFVGFPEVGTPGQDRVRLATTIANLAAQALHRLRLNEQTLEQSVSLSIALTDLGESYQATLLALSAALDARDRETVGHSRRVTKWALAIGRVLRLSEEQLTNLERGALLHDVGKIGISDNILLKAGPLTPEERMEMNRHPQLGYEMLKGIPFLKDALPVVLHHQEMYDGSGYPSGLRGSEIPLSARIFAVADTYDAMTSTRPYRDALPHQAAIREIIAQSGRQFDPQVVKAFISLFEADRNISPTARRNP